jgi:hypothetical protein
VSCRACGVPAERHDVPRRAWPCQAAPATLSVAKAGPRVPMAMLASLDRICLSRRRGTTMEWIDAEDW